VAGGAAASVSLTSQIKLVYRSKQQKLGRTNEKFIQYRFCGFDSSCLGLQLSAIEGFGGRGQNIAERHA
jgi:hypothetical protein